MVSDASSQTSTWRKKIAAPPMPVSIMVTSVVIFALLTWAFQALLSERANSPQFTIWAALAALMTIAYVALGVSSGKKMWKQYLDSDMKIPLTVLYFVLGAIVLAFLWYILPPAEASLPGNAIVIARLMPILGIAMMATTVIGLWLTYPKLNAVETSEEAKAKARMKDSIKLLRECRRDLGEYLTVISLVVSFAVVGTGALRNALLAHGWKPEQFPASNVLLYGAFFTGILMAIYVPIYLTWRTKSTDFIAKVASLPDNNSMPSETWEAEHTRLTKLLGADTTVSAHLTAAFGILAPLAASVLSVFVTEVTK